MTNEMCPNCGGAGWVWRSGTSDPYGDGSTFDDTRYSCDTCLGSGIRPTTNECDACRRGTMVCDGSSAGDKGACPACGHRRRCHTGLPMKSPERRVCWICGERILSPRWAVKQEGEPDYYYTHAVCARLHGQVSDSNLSAIRQAVLAELLDMQSEMFSGASYATAVRRELQP